MITKSLCIRIRKRKLWEYSINHGKDQILVGTEQTLERALTRISMYLLIERPDMEKEDIGRFSDY